MRSLGHCPVIRDPRDFLWPHSIESDRFIPETKTSTGRRKAQESKAHPAPIPNSRKTLTKAEPETPCWVEDKQAVFVFPASVARNLYSIGSPLISQESETANPFLASGRAPARIIFPLSSDHLITLLQFNVLRAYIINRHLISPLIPSSTDGCSSSALHVLPTPLLPQEIPPSLHPTFLQRTIPHEDWIDIVPHPTWRDNIILAIGSFDEDELWSDTIGGLFEGFPASEIEQRGVIAWSPPWDVSGWEISEGFWRKWGWSFKGCEDVLKATNRWREKRGEEPLIWEL